MPNENRPLKVFLCHSSADKSAVRKLYRYLKQRGVQPWLDERDLLPGQDWRAEIPKALYSSDVILVCLSKNSVDKEGYVQKEVSFALDKALEKPPGTIFIIPAKLEECDVPSGLIQYQWVDLFREDGRKRLMRSLNLRAERLGPSIAQASITEDVQEEEPENLNESLIGGPNRPVAYPLKPRKSILTKAMPSLKIAAVIGIVILLTWIGSRLRTSIYPSLTGDAAASPTVSVTAQKLTFVSSTPPRILLTPSLSPAPTIRHVVVEGESLMLIAQCYGANFAEMRNANPELGDPENLSPGMTVTIPNIGSVGNVYGPPCVGSYTVQSGDTWTSIAQRYNADVTVLQHLNPAGLSVGRVLIIPRNSAGGQKLLVPQPPIRLVIPPGSTSVTELASLEPLAVDRYVFTANEGQAMHIEVTSPAYSAEMTIYREGAAESLTATGWEWTGRMKESGDHIIEITSVADSLAIDYCLEVNFGTASSATCAAPTP